MSNVVAVFDNAVLADAVNKAARIAPNKGAAFDKAGGIEFMVNPASRMCRVRSTDLDVTFEQDIEMLDGKGEVRHWRMPAQFLSGLVGTLPMGDGAAAEFIDRGVDQAIRIKANRDVIKLNMYAGALDDALFKWQPNSEFWQAHDLAAKVDQVSWATDPKSNLLQGVHISGTHLIATDTQVMAMVPAVIDMPEPITVPLSTLTQLLNGASDCSLATAEKRCLIMLDEHTRVSSVLMEGKYPDVQRAMREDFIGSMKVHRATFSDTLDRLMVLGRADKLPVLRMVLKGGGLVSTLVLDLDIHDKGRMQSEFDVETEFEGDYETNFTPTKIQNALSHAKADFVHLDFGHTTPEKSPLSMMRMRDDKGYVAYIMPRKV